jgi:hypothetical protein
MRWESHGQSNVSEAAGFAEQTTKRAVSSTQNAAVRQTIEVRAIVGVKLLAIRILLPRELKKPRNRM